MDRATESLLDQVLSEREVDEDDAYEVTNAVQALEQVRRIFYGTPLEKVLDDAMQVCQKVTDVYKGD